MSTKERNTKMEKAIYKIRTRNGLVDQTGYAFCSGRMKFGVGKDCGIWVLTELRTGLCLYRAASRQAAINLYTAETEDKRRTIEKAAKEAVIFYGGEINTDIEPKDEIIGIWSK